MSQRDHSIASEFEFFVFLFLIAAFANEMYNTAFKKTAKLRKSDLAIMEGSKPADEWRKFSLAQKEK